MYLFNQKQKQKKKCDNKGFLEVLIGLWSMENNINKKFQKYTFYYGTYHLRLE